MKAFRKTAAFTLVELLVAVGITAVLAALLLAITTNTLTIWDRSVSALQMENEAQVVLARIVPDFESAVNLAGGNDWIEVESTEGEVTSVRFFSSLATTSADAADPTTLREVAYKLSGTVSPLRLFRWEGAALDALDSNYVFASPDVVTDSEFLLNESSDAWRVSFWRTPEEEIDLTVSTDRPRLVRVDFTLISADGSARLAAIQSGQSNEAESDVRRATTRTFTRWIELKGINAR